MPNEPYVHPTPIANLGDANFLNYGGRLVFPGVSEGDEFYMEAILEPPEDCEEDEETWTVYRFDLERFQVVEKGNHLYLVPEKWEAPWPHALSRYDEWFHQDLKAVAESQGTTVQELRAAFCSEDPVKRAWAWCAVSDHHGFHELYPLRLSQHEAHSRYGLLENCYCESCVPCQDND